MAGFLMARGHPVEEGGCAMPGAALGSGSFLSREQCSMSLDSHRRQGNGLLLQSMAQELAAAWRCWRRGGLNFCILMG